MRATLCPRPFPVVACLSKQYDCSSREHLPAIQQLSAEDNRDLLLYQTRLICFFVIWLHFLFYEKVGTRQYKTFAGNPVC